MLDWRGIPSLAALRAFEAAARHGSYSGAARELNVTHAAIAQHVRGLEDHFATPLMLRKGRAMAATAEGQALAAALNEGFGAIAAACRDLAERDKERPLRITVTPSFAAHWLMPRIGSFWCQHPDIQVEILPSITLTDLRADGVDVAIRYGLGGWPGVDSEPLMSAGHTAVAAPSYLGDFRPDCLADLADHTWLLDGSQREEVVWARANGIDLEAVPIRNFATDLLLREAIRAGIGIGILPAPSVADDIDSGRLIELCREEDSALAYHLLTRPGQVSAQRDTFIRWIKKEVRDGSRC